MQENPTQTPQEMQREIRGLKRKLALMESNLNRARLIADAQDRADTILSTSIKKELQFFKLILDNTTNILLLFDFEGRFAYASQTFLTGAGIANFGMITGRYYTDVLRTLISPESLERFSDALERSTVQKSTVTLEERMDIGFKGEPRTYSILITPMTDEDGKSTGIMALFNDITDINNALEAANRASMAKSDFLANMSHEIRTPLNAVIGMTAIARDSNDIEKIQYCLEKINDSSKHLLGVINDILDMSKIETNHFELSYTEFVFERMLLRIIDVMRFKIDEKHIVFTMYCDPAIPYAILSDEQRLTQVIMNLLSNAVKFTPDGGTIAIRAEAAACEGTEYTLRISVRDSGIGISAEQGPRLFKAFSQADSSISRKFGGTGLGLVITKNIINMMGGDITFSSVEGKGTTFTFDIKTQACQMNPVSKLNLEDITMLAVDDMPDVLTSISMYARKLGVPCYTASGAQGALDILKREHCDIVFVDWMMPGIDGLELVKRLSAMEDRQMIVIMISSADWSDIEKEAKAAGVNEFISKPILLPVIEGVLNKYCEDLSIGSSEESDDFSSKTVLLADDIEINREIIIALLEYTGINIVCAENGREAVERYTADPSAYDLIFMDVQMPEMDGYDATRRIRAAEADGGRRVPIVAMTANVFKEDIERCLASGMDDHIGKPVDVGELLDKLRHWVNGGSGG